MLRDAVEQIFVTSSAGEGRCSAQDTDLRNGIEEGGVMRIK